MSKDTKLIIHIGTHKTGTTSIQEYLKSHIDELYSSDDINYLEFDIPKKFNIPFTSQYNEEIVNDIKSYLEKNIVSGKTNLLSSEVFLGNSFEFYSNYKITANMLFDATLGYNRRIVVFFRRQDHFIQSCFMQHVSRGHISDFSKFYNRKKMRNLDWFSIANYYSDIFGNNRLEVKLYDPKSFINKTLFNVFGETIGSQTMASTDKSLTKNVGFSDKTLEVFKKVSRHLSYDEKKILKLELQQIFNRGYFAYYKFLSAEEVNYIYNYFLESNKKLADIYCQGHSFSGIDDLLNAPKTFKKHQIYIQLMSDLVKNKSELSSRKWKLLKSYLYTSGSTTWRRVRKKSITN